MISPVLFSAPRKISRFKLVKVLSRVSILLTDSGRLTAAKFTVFLHGFAPKMNSSTCLRTVYRRTKSTNHRMVHLVHWYAVHLFRVTA